MPKKLYLLEKEVLPIEHFGIVQENIFNTLELTN